MKQLLAIPLIILTLLACQKKASALTKQTTEKDSPITCDQGGCKGTYTGPEFINRSDVAHQFSNTMSRVVGDKLKAFYAKEIYLKVDFKNIIMTTKGMGSGEVTYFLSIPFTAVPEKCEAFTSFDHVGGWNHAPALASRKRQLQPLLLKDQELTISSLKTTPEGLEEYWIQWKHKEVQKDCE